MNNLVDRLKKYSQAHLLDELSLCHVDLNHLESPDYDEATKDFIAQISTIDVERIHKLYSSLTALKKEEVDPNLEDYEQMEALERFSLKEDALKEARALIGSGKAASLIMAGGQGSRLNHSGPKGTFKLDLGEFGIKSIFEIHIDYFKFLFLKHGVYQRLFIMTGESNHEDTVKFFEENRYFGYPKSFVKFIKQDMLPCIDLDGKILLAGRAKIAYAPDGNAGFSEILKRSGHMKALLDEGVKYLFVHNVDNVLTKFADEHFLASLIQQGADVAIKTTLKPSPEEKVGVIIKYKNVPSIVEYSEMPAKLRDLRDDSGNLKFADGSIGSYVFDLHFLNELHSMEHIYHLAKKKIAYFDGGKMVEPKTENGYKFEAYIFDLFRYANKIVPYRVDKALEFAPVKNAQGADSPASAAMAYYTKLNHLNSLAYESYLIYAEADDRAEDKIHAKNQALEAAQEQFMDLYHMYKKPEMLYYLAIISFNKKEYIAAYNNAFNSLKQGISGALKADLLEMLPKMEDFMHLQRAMSYAQSSRYFEALEELENVGEHLGEVFEYHYYMAFCRRKVGQYSNVVWHIKKAYELNPADAEIYAEMAFNMLLENDLENCKKALAEGLKLNANSLNLTMAMVDYYDRLNKPEDKAACLAKLDEIRANLEEQ